MNYFIIAFLLKTFIFYSCNGYSKLPPSINLCSQSDPNLSECLIKNGREVLPNIVKGNSIYHIPSFMPFKINKVSLEASDNIKLYADNVEISGFDTMELKDMKWDLDHKVIETKLFTPLLTITGTYNMNGHILIMNLKGSGPMNNTHYDNNISSTIVYSLISQSGKEFMNIETVKITFDIQKTHLYFGNMLNNPQISEQMNAFMNENWKILEDDLFPSIEAVLVDVLKSIINPILKKVSFDNILTP